MVVVRLLLGVLGCMLVVTLSGGRSQGTEDRDVTVVISLPATTEQSAARHITVENDVGEAFGGRVDVRGHMAGFEGSAKCRENTPTNLRCILYDSGGKQIGIIVGRYKGSSGWGRVELDGGQLIPWAWTGDTERRF